MKVTVTKYLNVRVGKPSVNAPCYQYLAPGSVIETDDRLYTGDSYKGVDKWIRDVAGNYYWSGGIEFPTGGTTDSTYWTNFFGLHVLADQYSAELASSSIAVLDTGITVNHPDLTGVLDKSRNFLFPGKSVTDLDGHGTHCCGIIAGTGAARIVGGASGIRINFGKIMTSSQPGLTGLTEGVLIDALQWASKLSDVISISAGIPSGTDALRRKVKEISEQKKIIVAAIGNAGQTKAGSYPAMLEDCIAVGALNSSFELSNLTVRESRIDICVPGETITSTLPLPSSHYGQKSGTSVATPLVACMVKFLKLKHPAADVAEIRSLLSERSSIKVQSQFQYKAIKPQPFSL